MLAVFHNGRKPDKPDSNGTFSLLLLWYFLTKVFSSVVITSFVFCLVINRIYREACNRHSIMSDEDIREQKGSNGLIYLH